MNFAIIQTMIYCGTMSVCTVQVIKEEYHEYQGLEIVILSFMLLMHISKIIIDLKKINIVFNISKSNKFNNQIVVPES